ncbi:2-keto-4-pentenoate hydratase/2-oxohepta-3-ene-1,7-dioic acid hydratase in catechol pathway [Paraburkholderia sp. 35.1]
MRFCSFETAQRRTYGVVCDAGVVDLKDALGAQAPESLEALIAAMADHRLRQETITAALLGVQPIPLNQVSWCPPLSRPGKIIGVAINNRMGQELAFRPFANPAFFLKPASSLIGCGRPVIVREEFGLTHPEPELGVVIGRGGKMIAESQALDHVFGYTIVNDVTSPGLKEQDSLEIVLPGVVRGGYRELLTWRHVRDEEHERSIYLTYHTLSKGADTFGPMGPWIVTRDEIQDPNRLTINSFDGDDLVFEDSTANLTFSVQRIIAHASKYMTLEPGDVLHCGTAMQPRIGGKYLMLAHWDIRRSGKPISVEIEGIGRLENPVIVEG